MISMNRKETRSTSVRYMGRLLYEEKYLQLENELQAARAFARYNPEARCTFSDTGFSNRDADLLARAWKMPASEVKSNIENKYLKGTEQGLRAQLKQIRRIYR